MSKTQDASTNRRDVPADTTVYCVASRGCSRRDVHLDRNCKYLTSLDEEDVNEGDRGEWPDANVCTVCAGLASFETSDDPMATEQLLRSLNQDDYP